jgi:hypothetical protein
MKNLRASLQNALTKRFPVGDLPFFLAIIFLMLSLYLAIRYKSVLVFRLSLYFAGAALFYALIWMSLYNYYIAREMRQIKKRFVKNPQL